MSSPDRRHANLRIPAHSHFLRLARVTAASLAADLPFTVGDVEDLRVAVDELAAAVIDGCDDDAILDLHFEVDEDALIVTGRVAGAGEAPELHPVARDLLGLVADGHELGIEGVDRVFQFTKRSATAS